MSEKLPMIVNGNFSFGYYETSNKKEVEQYYEVDLGELNLIAQHSKTKGEKDAGTHTDLELKTYNYHRDEDLLIQTTPILSELNIGTYTSIDEVVIDFDKLFPELLKAGYFLRGTKTACLLKSVKPSNDHTDFEYFFAAKLYLVSKKLSRLYKFLDYQLQSFLKDRKPTIDFVRCLRSALGQYGKYFNFTEIALDTIEKWMENPTSTLLDGVPDTSPNADIRWTGRKVDLVKIIYAAYHSNQINDGSGSITQICRIVLELFGEKYPDNDNTLSSAISKAKKNGFSHLNFIDKLNAGFRKYLSNLPSMKGKEIK